jgi:hypothetical protein
MNHNPLDLRVKEFTPLGPAPEQHRAQALKVRQYAIGLDLEQPGRCRGISQGPVLTMMAVA